jgi:acyl-CoA thioesterase-1
MALLTAILVSAGARAAIAAPVQIVVLGDSLSAGYMLPQDAAFPVVLEKALRRDGLDVEVANAGVSGDTATGGLERLDWAVPDGVQGVILELGANDIIARLKARNIPVLLAGMLAAPSLGREYGEKFNAIYPALAAKYGLTLYPFFLQGVAGHPELNLSDGMHPNRQGVELMVQSILPTVKAFVAGLRG